MAIYNSANNSYQSFNKTLFEAVVLADQFGNMVGPANPSGMAVDAFGRARTSQPFTLFDSFHRYQDNGKIGTANSATGATVSHNANAGLIEATLNTTSGSYVYRESNRVFAYQPGKSLQILETFVFPPAKANLRTRYGYFGSQNGFYLEQDGTDIYFVRRSFVDGTVNNTRVAKADWNIDKLDGTGPSNLTLDLSKSHILFIDVEWLGVGSVRMGFVINGQLIHCHTFNHANLNTSTYMTTACLPIRCELENTGITSSNSTLKIICATVISEGGYEIRGKARTVADGVTSAAQKSLATAGTYYPVQSIKLHPDRMDAIAIPKDIDLLPISQGNYHYKVLVDATINGAVWANTYSDSPVQYNTNASATISGGTVVAAGYVAATAQARSNIYLPPDGYFNFQLERNSFANTQSTFTLAVAADTNTSNVVGSISWVEIV